MRSRADEVQARALALLSGTGAASAPAEPVTATPAKPPVVQTPRSLAQAIVAPSVPALAGLLVLLVVVAAVLGVRVALARQEAAPVPVAASSAAPTPRPTGLVSAGTTAAAPVGVLPSPVPTAVVVDVAGAVQHPGVQHLPAGSRVDDALTRAGGARPDADLTTINRARVLVDGELVRVPKVGETPVAPPAAAAPASPGGSTGAAAAAPGSPVDLNTADAAALDALPGIGPALASRIIEWRTAHGRFTSVDELGEVSGIGDATLARLRPLVRV